LPHSFNSFNGTVWTTTIPLAAVASPKDNLLRVYVGCAGEETANTALVYRVLPAAEEAPFPRRGNLWGSSNFINKPIEYAAANVDMWLGMLLGFRQ
jgi:hypothetical protein